MTRLPVVVAVVIASGSAGCSSNGGGTGRPVLAAPPSVAPSAVLRTMDGGHTCFVRRAVDDNERVRGLVNVDSHPAGVIAVWLPATGQRPCRAALTRGNADLARRLAKDVAAAPKWPSGGYNCPNDNGTGARLYFERPKSADVELVDVRLAGCRVMDAPGRSARQMTDRFTRDLRPIAPAPWRAAM